LAMIIACPLAYFVTERLLQNFAYRITQNFTPYILVFTIISVLTFILIAGQCFKAAIAKPVTSLRTE